MLSPNRSDIFLENKNSQKILKFLFLICPLIWGIFNLPLRILGFHFEMTPGDLGDPRLINYLLEHGYQFLIGNQDSFYNAPFFYPAKNAVSLSDNMIGSLPFYSLYRFFGFNRETAFQLWWLTCFLLNYFISFYYFKKFSGNFYISVIAAWLFAFSLLNIVHLGYVQMNSKYMLPVIFFYFFDWLRTGEKRSFYLVLSAFFLQLLISIYFSVFTVLGIVVTCIIHFVVTRSFKPFTEMLTQPLSYKFQWLALLTAVLACILYLQPNLAVLNEVAQLKKYEWVIEPIPKLSSFIIAPSISSWAPRIGFGAEEFQYSWWFHCFFPGLFNFIVILLLPVLILFKRKTLGHQFFIILLSFATLFFLSIRYNNEFSPIKFFYYIHFFGPITFPARVFILIELVYLFLLLHVLNEILSINGKVLKAVTLCAIMVFLMWDHSLQVEQLRGTRKVDLEKRYANLEAAISRKNLKDLKILAVTTERNTPDRKFLLDAMMVAQKRGMKCINGYSSNAPNYLAGLFWSVPTRETLKDYCLKNNIDIAKVVIIEDPNP